MFCKKNIDFEPTKMFVRTTKDRPQQSRDGLFGSISRAVLRQYYCLPLQAGAARQPTTPIIYPKGDVFNDSVQR